MARIPLATTASMSTVNACQEECYAEKMDLSISPIFFCTISKDRPPSHAPQPIGVVTRAASSLRRQ